MTFVLPNGLRTSIEKMPEPMNAYSRHVASWRAWDGHQPVKHVVTGPMFKAEDSEHETAALTEFSELLGQKLRDFPPYTGQFKNGRWE